MNGLQMCHFVGNIELPIKRNVSCGESTGVTVVDNGDLGYLLMQLFNTWCQNWLSIWEKKISPLPYKLT